MQNAFHETFIQFLSFLDILLMYGIPTLMYPKCFQENYLSALSEISNSATTLYQFRAGHILYCITTLLASNFVEALTNNPPAIISYLTVLQHFSPLIGSCQL